MAQTEGETAKLNSSPSYEQGSTATWPGGPPIIHQNVAIIECASATILEELLKGTTLKNFVVRYLTPTTILVDQQRTDDIMKFLTKRGYEPKVMR